jgi:ferritin-like metal-binding protein YciE
MAGLIAEGDAIVAAQGDRRSRRLLDQTLDEEGQADKLLTKLATGGLLKAGINERARTT